MSQPFPLCVEHTKLHRQLEQVEGHRCHQCMNNALRLLEGVAVSAKDLLRTAAEFGISSDSIGDYVHALEEAVAEYEFGVVADGVPIRTDVNGDECPHKYFNAENKCTRCGVDVDLLDAEQRAGMQRGFRGEPAPGAPPLVDRSSPRRSRFERAGDHDCAVHDERHSPSHGGDREALAKVLASAFHDPTVIKDWGKYPARVADWMRVADAAMAHCAAKLEGVVVAEGTLEYAKAPFRAHAIRLTNGNRDIYFSGWTGDADTFGHLDGKPVKVVMVGMEGS